MEVGGECFDSYPQLTNEVEEFRFDHVWQISLSTWEFSTSDGVLVVDDGWRIRSGKIVYFASRVRISSCLIWRPYVEGLRACSIMPSALAFSVQQLNGFEHTILVSRPELYFRKRLPEADEKSMQAGPFQMK